MSKIGELALTGQAAPEIPRSFELAVSKFVEAADVGNEEAQFNLGILYANILESDPHYDIMRRLCHGRGNQEGEELEPSREALSVLY